jgi:nuclear pore complex protein Nup98-Nup96
VFGTSTAQPSTGFGFGANAANNNAPKPSIFGQPAAAPAQNAFGGTNIFGNPTQQQAPAQQQTGFGFGANNNAQQQQQPANSNPRKFSLSILKRLVDI